MTNRRLKDLEDNIDKDKELLKDFEDALGYETNPRIKARYRQDIERQKESIIRYEYELSQLKQELSAEPEAETQLLYVESQLQQMNNKIDALLSGQAAIRSDINAMRQAILNRYDASEQTIIRTITEQLNTNQLALVEQLLNAVESNQVSHSQIQQMLTVIESKIDSLPSNQATVNEILKDPELDITQKLKIAIPIIPMLVE